MRAYFGAWLPLAPWLLASCQPAARVESPERNSAKAPSVDEPKSVETARAKAADVPEREGRPAALPPELSFLAGFHWQFAPAPLVEQLPAGTLSSSEVDRFALRPVSSGEGELLCVLDDQAPRPLLRGAQLGALVLEDRELAPGAHVLTVVRVNRSARRLDFQVAAFAVDQPAADAGGLWPCVFVSPAGTHHGTVEPLEVLVLPLSRDVTTVELTATASWGVSHLTLPVGSSVTMSSQQSGDVALRARCRGSGDGGAETAVERIVTLNRDVDAPGGQP